MSFFSVGIQYFSNGIYGAYNVIQNAMQSVKKVEEIDQYTLIELEGYQKKTDF